MPAPRSAPWTAASTAAFPWPAPTAMLHACAAASMYSLFGEGASAALDASAAQHFDNVEPVPVFLPASASPASTGAPASSGTRVSCSVGVGVGAGAAEGKGGGGSSFLQPVEAAS